MEHTEKIADWLSIEIRLRIRWFRSRLTIEIQFINTGHQEENIAFSNNRCDAELLSLELLSESGERILPTARMKIRPKNPEPQYHCLEQGGSFVYKLNGKLKQYSIYFPGAIFSFEPGKQYCFRFQYLGVQSNELLWKAPV